MRARLGSHGGGKRRGGGRRHPQAELAEHAGVTGLLVSPDILQAIVTTNGIADSQLSLPDVPPLVGVAFFHQMIPFEVDAGGALLAITATNSLRLVAGDF